MKQKKKLLAGIMLAGFTLVAGLTGVAMAQQGSTPYAQGTYVSTTNSHGGPLTVAVTVDDKVIKDIKLVQSKDTVMLGDTAFDTIRKQILDHQTLDVDMVSGATVSSYAVVTAVTDALKLAGADIEALKAKAIPKTAPSQLTWETDVVVIGSGLAGISAAIEARENGADVIMLEKLGRVGGTSALSAGWVQAAGTEIQAKNDINDTSEQFYEDWMMLANRAKDNKHIDPEMVRYITSHSAENIDWLIDHGVTMMDDLFAAGIYEGRNVDRIHQTQGGKGYIIKGVYETAQELGVDTHLNTRATELIKNGGSITGVKAVDKDGNQLIFKAKKGVVIASGGFAGNKEMMAEYYPLFTDYYNDSVDTGDSLLMGKAVGADILLSTSLQLHHALITDSSLGYFTPECIYVTPEGERYVDEAEYFYTRTRTLSELGFGDTSMIIPQKIYNEHKAGVDKAIEIGRGFKADTIEELAEKMAMKPDVLKATLDRYNQLVRAGKDGDFNKPSNYLLPIEAPYIGLDLSGTLNDTYTGLNINIKAQVLDTNGTPIKGLYAAGGAAAAKVLNQEYIGSGSALLNGLTFGRIAGAQAAIR